MEVISVISARAIWLINTVDLNPKGLRIFPHLTEALIDAYDFDDPPEDTAQPRNSIKLKNGAFDFNGEAFRVGLEIYDDGFVGDSASSTDLTETFLQDALAWAERTFGLKFAPSLLMDKIYYSEVVVRFESRVATAFSPFAQFSDLLAKSVTPTEAEGFMLSAITFASRLPAGNNPKAITLERRANTAPDANVFYCKAPLATQGFIKLLSSFDDLLAGSRDSSKATT